MTLIISLSIYIVDKFSNFCQLKIIYFSIYIARSKNLGINLSSDLSFNRNIQFIILEPLNTFRYIKRNCFKFTHLELGVHKYILHHPNNIQS